MKQAIWSRLCSLGKRLTVEFTPLVMAASGRLAAILGVGEAEEDEQIVAQRRTGEESAGDKAGKDGKPDPRELDRAPPRRL